MSDQQSRPLPYRGEYGATRPSGLSDLPLPPGRLPLLHAGRLRKRWRYVAVHAPRLQLCAANVAIGPMSQSFWAVWDRQGKRLHERTRVGRSRVAAPEGRLQVADDGVVIDLELDEVPGVETVTGYGRGWAWTRKQGGIAARGTVTIDGEAIALEAPAIIDDSAGFHPRHVDWRWSAGVGTSGDDRAVAWNLVTGIHDSPEASERTVWIDGEPIEVSPCSFATDLSTISFETGEQLVFHEDAMRTRRENLLVVRSDYAQPFGSFTGSLPQAGQLRDGLGVMERHTVAW